MQDENTRFTTSQPDQELVSVGMFPLEGTAFTLVRIAPNQYLLTNDQGQSIELKATTIIELTGSMGDEEYTIVCEDADNAWMEARVARGEV